MKWTTEAKVGAFTILALALFAYSIIFLNNITLFAPKMIEISGTFDSVTGLKSGNAVRYSGVSVGKVREIYVSPNGVTVRMTINKGTEIPVDSEFTLQSDGILGEKFIEVTPGDSKEYLENGAKIAGSGQNTMDKTVAEVNQVMSESTKMLKSINSIIGDAQTQQSMKMAIRNTDAITANMANVTGQINQTLAQNTTNINEMAANMAAISRNMNGVTAQLNQSIHTMDGDGAMSADMRNIVANMKTTTESVNKMAKAMEGVVTDPQSAADIKETLHNTAQITSSLNRLTGGIGGSIKTDTNLEMLYNTSDERYSPNFNFRLFTDESIFALGATHVGDGTKLELNYGRLLTPNWSVRMGIFDGAVGAGLDWGLKSKPFALSIAAMDPNDFRYRIRGEVRLFDNLNAIAQFSRPFGTTGAGNYYGLSYSF